MFVLCQWKEGQAENAVGDRRGKMARVIVLGEQRDPYLVQNVATALVVAHARAG